MPMLYRTSRDDLNVWSPSLLVERRPCASSSRTIPSNQKRTSTGTTLSWKEATAVQLRWLPSLVGHYVGLIGIDYAFVYLQMAVRFLVILPGFLPLLLLVLSPSWLALSVFWLWVVLSVLIILYVVLPEKARGWTGDALRRGWSVVWRRKSM